VPLASIPALASIADTRSGRPLVLRERAGGRFDAAVDVPVG
jgi:hypothetical protein